VTPYRRHVRGRHIMPRPLTLDQLRQRLDCSLVEAHALLEGLRFPHAFVDCEGVWRIPLPDIDAYVRTNNT